ncbi:MAG TPA: hypothetical protein VI298_09615 [Geobacteraceae bacterium]
MIKRFLLFIASRPKKAALLAAAALAVPLLVMAVTVHFDIKGHWDGIFLLKGKGWWRYELKDDLYVGDGDRLVWSWDFDDPRFRLARPLRRHKPGEPYLYYEWDVKDGSGFIRNFLANGTQLLTCFGRYMDDDHEYVHGLFVGGGLPASVAGGDNVFMDETGMAYYDGRRWYHVWCNVNEGIIAAQSKAPITPSRWKFLGSRIIDESDKSMVIASSHEATVDGVPLRIDRYVYLNAGDTYFVLSIKITNIGTVPAAYFYVYGDEPWVGNYGNSAGNVGWTKDGLIKYETVLDSTRYSYAGIFDYGNDAIGEGHDFTMTANFIEWLGKEKPDTVYFSNDSGEMKADPAQKVPLASNTRFIGLQWGPRVLNPQQSAYYTLAIGMAGHDPKTGFPVKPDINVANIQ